MSLSLRPSLMSRWLCSLLLCWLPGLAAAAPAPLPVVATLEPLALLLKDVGGERLRVRVLLPSGASPHHFALRPSQRAALDEAALVFWGGPALERPLAALLAQRPAATVVALDAVDHHHESHRWLEPAAMVQAAARLADALALLDPEGAAFYHQRAQVVRNDLVQTETAMRQQLAPWRDTPLLLDHDFLDAFWPAMGLPQPWVIRPHPEQQPGTAHVRALTRQLSSAPAVCYLRETGAPMDALAARIMQGAVVATREINVLAPVGDANYPAYLLAVGQQLEACLQAAAGMAGKKKP